MSPSLLSGAILVSLFGCGREQPAWSVSRNDTILEVAYGSGRTYPQYAALHLTSGYLRLNPGPGSDWGTSVILLPSFWEGGTLHQGAPVEATWDSRAHDLVLNIQGTIARLFVTVEVRLTPPDGDSVTATVNLSTSGDVRLDPRPGEAFKQVMLSSMHIAPDRWDTQSASLNGTTIALPGSGWIVNPPVTGTRFGLRGGASAWKANAPTVEIELDAPRQITGWVTPSADPNDDNVGLWAGSDQIVRAWRYTIVTRR